MADIGGKMLRWGTATLAVTFFVALGCAGLFQKPEETTQPPLSAEEVAAIDSALRTLRGRLDSVHTNDFPEQVVFLYGPPRRVRHKIEVSPPLGVRDPLARVVIYTSYMYDLYDLALRANPTLAAHPPVAIYGRGRQAGLSPEFYFIFVDGRLHTVSNHEFF